MYRLSTRTVKLQCENAIIAEMVSPPDQLNATQSSITLHKSLRERLTRPLYTRHNICPSFLPHLLEQVFRLPRLLEYRPVGPEIRHINVDIAIRI